MTIVTGGAHSAYGNEAAGDQKQNDTPDYSGEVSMREYTSESSFASRYSGWTIVRPIDPDVASKAASLMITACNNGHIGYVYGGKGMWCQGGSNYVNTQTDCITDCSGLVSECASEAIGSKVYAATSGLASALANTGYFTVVGTFSSYAATPVYNGDALIKPGSHTDLVVAGNPREGKEDEILVTSGTGAGGAAAGTTTQIVAQRTGYTLEGEFVPRTVEPSDKDEGAKYYDNKYGKTKNGSYAWGRFSEICESECDLSRGEPRTWYANTEDGYTRSVSPALGAVMCFTNIYDKSDAGMVSIVEEVGDGYVYVSERSVKTGKFQYVKRTKKDGSWNLDLDKDGKDEYMFQGFILNPVVQSSGLEEETHFQSFVDTALGQLGKGPSFTKKYGGIKTSNQAWSGGFIRAVAARTGGILNVIIPDTSSCTTIASLGVSRNMGDWYDGALLGGSPEPQVGDIALFRAASTEARIKYTADKAGIVTEVSSKGADTASGKVKYSFKVIMGDVDNKVQKKSYTTESKTFVGLYRPDWDKVDTISAAEETRTALYGMYTEGTSIEDAAIRDLKYLSFSGGDFKPSIKSTGIKLCTINYTGMLANLYGMFSEIQEYLQRIETQSSYDPNVSASTISTTSTDISHTILADVELVDGGSVKVGAQTITADTTFSVIFSSIKKYLGNGPGAIGIMANMYQESRFETSAKNSSGYMGLCQWDPKYRGPKMVQKCLDYNGQQWENNLEGQLAYLFEELDTGYTRVRDACKVVADSVDGAYAACDTFLKLFEAPGNYEAEVPLRRSYAKGIWTLIYGAKQ